MNGPGSGSARGAAKGEGAGAVVSYAVGAPEYAEVSYVGVPGPDAPVPGVPDSGAACFGSAGSVVPYLGVPCSGVS